ncbi:MAG: phosphoglycerate mutase family protein [bacterium]|nr:phosphoglycerate mutase family protein [bacterium]
MSALKLWLIRHGETEINTGIWSAKPDETHLTDKGRKQAENAAAQISGPPDQFFVSPLIRAQETLQFFLNLWPNTPTVILPIQEFNYLSSSRLLLLSSAARKHEIIAYWQKNDPYFCDDRDTESFASFLQRVATFHQFIMQQKGFVVVIGHGQFLKAFQLGLIHGFTLDFNWMHLFREQEIQKPVKNGQIIKLYFND